MAQTLQKRLFRDIDLDDSFFDSLKADYKEFPNWFAKKQNTEAFVFYSANGGLDGFLYLKKEKEQIGSNEVQEIDVERLKIGTFKINPHGTRLGERFLKRAFDVAIANNLTQVYVTVFAKHVGLVDLFKKYGFDLIGQKKSENGVEGIYLKDFNKLQKTVASNYPKIPIKKNRHFALSLYPKWHTRLLPDSLLANENETIITDVSHTNSIHKIYLTSMGGVDQLLVGDTLLIYRTADGGSGYYTSVITSIGVVEDVRHIGSFEKQEDFLHYCLPYSIFTEAELINFYSTKKYPFLIQFTYNLALTKKINRKLLIEEVGISRDAYAGFFKITTIQLKKILTLSTDYKKSVLFSIHPEFAEAILSGKKQVEFRRVIFKRSEIKEVVIYATYPIQRVVGRFEIDEVLAAKPDVLWEKTKNIGGVSKEKFKNYFLGKDIGFGIKIKNPIRFEKSQPLSKYVVSNTAPQSFCYV